MLTPIAVLSGLLVVSAARHYNVGVLMVNSSVTNRFDIQRIGPAIDIAAEKCERDFGVHLKLIPGYYPRGCSQEKAIGKATDLTTNCNGSTIAAFIGPACSDDLQIVGRYASYRKIPILTGLGDILLKRDEFTTLIRMSYELEDKGKAIVKFLKHFDWDHFGLIFRYEDVYYSTLANIVIKYAREADVKITCKEYYRRAENKTVLSDLNELMEKMKECSRVIVILGGDREVRQMLLIAYKLQMTHSGEYAFICPELMRSEAYGNASWAGGKEEYSVKLKIKKAYEALMIVTLDQPVSEEYMTFTDDVISRAYTKYNFVYKEKEVNYFTASFHDAVWLLCNAIYESGTQNTLDTTQLLSKLKNLKGVPGISGSITIDEKGDRVAEYALLDQTDTKTGNFEVVLKYSGSNKLLDTTEAIHWPAGVKPKARPKCGFDGKDEICQEFPKWQAILTAVLIILLIVIIVGIFVYRKLKLEAELANMVWKVRWEELTFTKNCRSSWMMSRLSLTSAMSSKMEKGWVCWAPKLRDSTYLETCGLACELPQQFGLTAVYKENTVAVKRLSRQKKIELTRSVLMELKIMREAQHQNIARFIGACIESPNIAILTEYCPKGSLQDVLHNDSLDLDWMFRYSLINDIVKGMAFLHNSEVGSHGRLRSSNCLVDSHFVLKITDFGLPSFRKDETYIEFEIGDQKIRRSYC